MSKTLASQTLLPVHSKSHHASSSSTQQTDLFRIRLVGKDKQPLDLSREDHKKVFEESMQKWGEAMANNEDQSKYGYIDIGGTKLEPFGEAYAAA